LYIVKLYYTFSFFVDVVRDGKFSLAVKTETGINMMRFCNIALRFILLVFVSSNVYSQTFDDLRGRWEGVHYYGDTTRLVDGTLIVRASTIDSMKMILTIDGLKQGKFTGKLHEHFYSNPRGSYFKADVRGFIKDEKIHFDTIRITERNMPPGNRWCAPKAMGTMVKSKDIFLLQMWFESSLTCTIGPAILERKAWLPEPPPQPPKDTVKVQAPLSLPGNKDSISITQKFKTRQQTVNTTISVQSDSIKINFLDNSVVDGDSISVFINGQLQVAHVRLTAKPFTMTVYFEKGVNEIEVSMFAENLGTLPPNTALMQIIDGDKIHRAFLSSDNRSNAVIRLKRVK